MVGTMPGRRTSSGALTLLSCGALLVLLLLFGISAVEAHPGLGTTTTVPPVTLDTAAPQSTPTSTIPAPAVPSTATPWVWAALLILTGIAGARGARHPRRLAGIMAVALAVFVGETALHSAHHLNDPKRAERCPVYSASVHVTGLTAAPATPELPPPVPTLARPVPVPSSCSSGCWTARSRAPRPSRSRSALALVSLTRPTV